MVLLQGGVPVCTAPRAPARAGAAACRCGRELTTATTQRVTCAPCGAAQVVAVTGRLLKSSPGSLEALLLRGQAYLYLNDHELAKRHFGEALRWAVREVHKAAGPQGRCSGG